MESSRSKHNAHSVVGDDVMSASPDSFVPTDRPRPVRADKRPRDEHDEESVGDKGLYWEDDAKASTEITKAIGHELMPIRQSSRHCETSPGITTSSTVIVWSVLCKLEDQMCPERRDEYRQLCCDKMKTISPDGVQEHLEKTAPFLNPQFAILHWWAPIPTSPEIKWPFVCNTVPQYASQVSLPGSMDAIRTWTEEVLADPGAVTRERIRALVHRDLDYCDDDAPGDRSRKVLLRMGIWSHCLMKRPTETRPLWTILHSEGAPVHITTFAWLLRDDHHLDVVRSLFEAGLVCTYHLPLLCNFVADVSRDIVTGMKISSDMYAVVNEGISFLTTTVPFQILHPDWVPKRSSSNASAFCPTPRGTPRPSPSDLTSAMDDGDVNFFQT